ncbi:hypothetical protein [Kutzneria buriramensis]|uniref:Secreted protein n=1 Tax=Kutzneria buriramensis TaxID=1045776 RepID=A0A3E0G5E6_9PSEU|nr:hypothetical protein [Kutzneria buriramensis]REH17981.1 hypothetical protein BCF44_13913 [Kutzneria buriramensis]
MELKMRIVRAAVAAGVLAAAVVGLSTASASASTGAIHYFSGKATIEYIANFEKPTVEAECSDAHGVIVSSGLVHVGTGQQDWEWQVACDFDRSVG